MDKIKDILKNKEEYALYILGIEHIITTSSGQNNNENMCIYFKCKTSFHRLLVHLVSSIYGLYHKTLQPKKINKKWHLRTDVTDKEMMRMEGDIIELGGHGPSCQDCNWMWEWRGPYNNNFLIVQGVPKIPEETISDYWNNTHTTHKQKTNYEIRDECMCGYTETNYSVPNGSSLPGHTHISFDERGKAMFSGEYGKPKYFTDVYIKQK